MARPRESKRVLDQLEESLLTDCDCYGCRNERVGIRKAFQAIRDLYRESTVPADWTAAPRREWAIQSNKAGLVLDVTVDKDSVLTLDDKDGACEVRLEFNAGKHITVFEDEERSGWVIGPRCCGPATREALDRPYIGQRVILNCLPWGGDFLGTIVQIHPLEETYLGRPLCVVDLDCQVQWVRNVVFYPERVEEIKGTFWQICYPSPHPVLGEEEPKLRDIATRLGVALGLHPEDLFDQFVIAFSQKRED